MLHRLLLFPLWLFVGAMGAQRLTFPFSCGQVLLFTAGDIAKYFGGSNPQIPYVQVAMWNDYERRNCG